MAYNATMKPAEAIGIIDAQLRWIRQQAQAAVAALAGNVTATQIFQMLDNIRSPLALINAAAAVPGIAVYAQAQLPNNPAYDVVTEFTNTINVIQGVINWIVANFPKDAGGFAQAYTIATNGDRTPVTFTPAQTAGLATQFNSIVTQIEIV